ncbi:MAG: hypothetical protein ACM3PU_01605 [Gemmatimonadota bacterium]
MPAVLSGVVVKGPVIGGEVCASRIVQGDADRASAVCGALDAAGAFRLQVPAASGDYLVEASQVRYLDEAAAGAPADLATTLATVVTTPQAGNVAQAPITALTEIAVRSLRAKGLPLNASNHASEWRRLGVIFGLSAAELAALPAFDATVRPANASAAAAASIAVYARSSGLSVADALSAFGSAMAEPEPDDQLLSLNDGLIEAARGTFADAGLQSRPLRVYGFGGVFGEALPMDANQVCQMTATGVDTQVFMPMLVEAVHYTICIQGMPAGAVCGEALQRALDYQWLPTNTGNASLSTVLTRAVAAFRADFERYRYSYDLSCDSAPTFRTYYLNGQLFPL